MESKYKDLEPIFNKMIRYLPENRPTVYELLDTFGNLMKNQDKRQKLLLDVTDSGFKQALNDIEQIKLLTT